MAVNKCYITSCNIPLLLYTNSYIFYRHSQQQDDLTAQHAEEVERLHDQIRRERGRNTDERCHYEREAEQVRRIANERANAEIARIKEEEDNKRKVLVKKHQVINIKIRLQQLDICQNF